MKLTTYFNGDSLMKERNHHQFRNDYSSLAHPRILKALMRYSSKQIEPYGLDGHSLNAERLIDDVFGCPNGKVFFLAGGTQTNMVFISSALKNHEGVISTVSGHINVHETSAIEGGGNKVLTVNGKNGKIYPEDIDMVMAKHIDMHMTKPKMVYISNSTEIGTIYTKEELLALRKKCDEHKLYLYMDGARLGAAITSKENDVLPCLIGQVCDAFYVGGTKNGLLLGEALVINNKALARDFRYVIKNKGAMLAKGYLLGIEFEEAFKDGLYFEIAKKTNDMAQYLKEGMRALKIDVEDSPTNQLFVALEKELALRIVKEFQTEIWEDKGDKLVIRFVTSFLTEKEDVDDLLAFLKKAK